MRAQRVHGDLVGSRKGRRAEDLTVDQPCHRSIIPRERYRARMGVHELSENLLLTGREMIQHVAPLAVDLLRLPPNASSTEQQGQSVNG